MLKKNTLEILLFSSFLFFYCLSYISIYFEIYPYCPDDTLTVKTTCVNFDNPFVGAASYTSKILFSLFFIILQKNKTKNYQIILVMISLAIFSAGAK